MMTTLVLVAALALPVTASNEARTNETSETTNAQTKDDAFDLFVAGAVVGSFLAVTGVLAVGSLWQLHEQTADNVANEDGHVTPFVLALSAAPLAALVGGAIGGGAGVAIAALRDDAKEDPE